MPPWAQWVVGTILSLSALVIALGDRIGRWGGRAQRQESDGRVLERTADATQRAEVVDATMSSSLRALTEIVGKMDNKLDKLGADITDEKIASADARARAEGDRERLARAEARLDACEARITRVDEQHTARITRVDEQQTQARHALRNEMHGPGALSDVADAIKAQSEATARAADAMAAIAARLPKGRT
jgi:uncharacterized phage infection (PIP) family protein YhgE